MVPMRVAVANGAGARRRLGALSPARRRGGARAAGGPSPRRRYPRGNAASRRTSLGCVEFPKPRGHAGPSRRHGRRVSLRPDGRRRRWRVFAARATKARAEGDVAAADAQRAQPARTPSVSLRAPASEDAAWRRAWSAEVATDPPGRARSSRSRQPSRWTFSSTSRRHRPDALRRRPAARGRSSAAACAGPSMRRRGERGGRRRPARRGDLVLRAIGPTT